MKLSEFGSKLSGHAGIVSLMDDLGASMSSGRSFRMLGGGNPARIPEVEARFRKSMRDILDDGDRFEKTIGTYDGPQGNARFIEALADLFQSEFGWNTGPENIYITNGSQSGFFALFNMFAGKRSDGRQGKILLPITPEYIGYSDTGVQDPIFDSHQPTIDTLDDLYFKYRVNFDNISVDESIGAICVSRPTNPTGNVLTDEEVETLSVLASKNHIPLIVDDAYGAPFPNIIFSSATPIWNDNTILCLSLSKLGLPGVRTGIVVARRDIIRALSNVAAVMNLAPGSFGPDLALDLVKSREIISLSNEVIRPYYQGRVQQAIQWIRDAMAGYPLYVHKPEGAIFLWLWFPGLPIASQDLYERLKARGVLVIAGRHFFPGMDAVWRHRHECIRVTYSQNPEDVEAGLGIIAEEVIRAYDERQQTA
ncbi:MAG: Valine--pyruvate aminotransferase [Gammaproteobacteria bacterium]|nr:Valine--pyruvate aminotransferase [Gammaproteobacteria bacterium]